MTFGPYAIKRLCPHLPDAMVWGVALSSAAGEFGIDDPAQQAMWLANLIYESRGFRDLEENLSYSATRLAQVWPQRFAVRGIPANGPNPHAYELAYKPELLANYVYANRPELGNGPTYSGDGWHYRGRYPCQLTGKFNYHACHDVIGIPDLENPDALLEDVMGMARVCGWYWKHRNFGALAKEGNLQQVVHMWVGYRGKGQHESLPRRDAIYRDAFSALRVA